MFTGLIEDVGRIAALEKRGSAAVVKVQTALPPQEFRLGDSVAVNGICLTVTAIDGNILSFDASPETLERSSLRRAASGTRVNLERALRLSDRLGGHLVSGHVDCVGVIEQRREISGNSVFSFRIPEQQIRYVAEKGSIAIDGISLTVNSVTGTLFTVNVIPHTAGMTTLAERRAGDEVNIETDILGKYVERLLSFRGEPKGEGLSMELLAKNGFL